LTAPSASGKVLHQQGVDRVDRLLDAGGKAPFLERRLHRRHDPFPGGGIDMRQQAAVGDDLDRPLGEQQVDQDAVVGRRVPDPELAEQGDGPLARAGVRRR
jgi:hypothetical protein